MAKTFETILKDFKTNIRVTKSPIDMSVDMALRHAIEQHEEATKVDMKNNKLDKYFDWHDGFNSHARAVADKEDRFWGRTKIVCPCGEVSEAKKKEVDEKLKKEFMGAKMTWKIATGCKHGCPYCYCRRLMKDMTPKYHPDRIEEPLKLKTPTMIFVANTGDLFGEWVKDWQIKEVLETIKRCPQHTFQLLTKNPKRYEDFEYSPNCWIGTSVTCQEDIKRINSVRHILTAGVRFISFEPLQGEISGVDFRGIDWAIVGAESVEKAWKPKDEKQAQAWAKPLIAEIRAAGVPLFCKPNLRWPERIREMPINKVDVFFKDIKPIDSIDVNIKI